MHIPKSSEFRSESFSYYFLCHIGTCPLDEVSDSDKPLLYCIYAMKAKDSDVLRKTIVICHKTISVYASMSTPRLVLANNATRILISENASLLPNNPFAPFVTRILQIKGEAVKRK